MASRDVTTSTYTVKGIREDLSGIISQISPEDTPFTSAIGSGEKASQTFYEWQTDALAVPDLTNARIEGEDYDTITYPAAIPTVRLGNYVQISSKRALVSGTVEKVVKAG